MKQSQNKNRMRGRGGRKPTNPLSRNFESNGPDVKIRGNASHIAEKYGALARDALSSGDRVMAENYLQHAEHYHRIVASVAQSQPGAQAGTRSEDAANTRQPSVGANASAEGQDPANEEIDDAGIAANGSGAEFSDDEGENRPRRRTRSPRTTARSANGNGTTRRPRSRDAVDKKPRRQKEDTHGADTYGADGISDDAAALPQSLVGGFAGSEAAEEAGAGED